MVGGHRTVVLQRVAKEASLSPPQGPHEVEVDATKPILQSWKLRLRELRLFVGVELGY